MKRTFQHKFKGGITATVTIDDQFAQGTRQHFSVEWSRTPKPNIIPEYMRWVHTVNEMIASEIEGSVMHVFQLPGGRIESWIYEPHQPARKL